MPFQLGAPELIIVLVIIVVVFGVGRVSKIAGEIGSSVREFRTSLQGHQPADQPAQPAEEKH